MFQFGVLLIKTCGKISQFKLRNPGVVLYAMFVPSETKFLAIRFDLASNMGSNNNILKI